MSSVRSQSGMEAVFRMSGATFSVTPAVYGRAVQLDFISAEEARGKCDRSKGDYETSV